MDCVRWKLFESLIFPYAEIARFHLHWETKEAAEMRLATDDSIESRLANPSQTIKANYVSFITIVSNDKNGKTINANGTYSTMKQKVNYKIFIFRDRVFIKKRIVKDLNFSLNPIVLR